MRLTTSEWRTDPRWTSHIHLDFLRDLLQLWDNLNRCGAGADNTNSLAREVHGVIPVRRVHQRALEVVETFDLWPLPVIQDSGPVDDNVRPILGDLSSHRVLECNVPDCFLGVPNRLDQLRVQLDILLGSMALDEAFEVLLDLGSICKVVAPLWIGIPGIPIKMRWDIACNSRVSATTFSMATFLQLRFLIASLYLRVLIPGSSIVWILLEKRQLPRSSFEHLLHLVCEAYSCAGSC